MKKKYLIKIIRLFIGTFISAIGVICLIHANIGVEPWSVLHQGMSLTFGITYGFASIIVGMSALVIGIVLREPFGYATLANIFLCGIYIDCIEAAEIVPYMESTPSGIVMLMSGIVILSYGTYFYMVSGTGSGPRDMLMIALSKKTGRTPGFCRIIVELLVFITGLILGGPIGIGTVITVVTMGPIINIVFRLHHFYPEKMKMENVFETTRNIKSAFSSTR